MKRLGYGHVRVLHAPGYWDDGMTLISHDPLPEVPYAAANQSREWWAIPEDERPAPDAWWTYHALYIDPIDLSPWVEYEVKALPGDPYGFLVGGITVHNFEADPDLPQEGWGYYLVPPGEWTKGFSSMQEAARAAHAVVATW